MLRPISIERKTYTIDEIVIILGIPKTAVYKLLKKEALLTYIWVKSCIKLQDFLLLWAFY